MIRKILLLVFVTLFALGGWLIFSWWSFVNTPLIDKNSEPVVFVFDKGDLIKKVAYKLEQRSVLKHPAFFLIFVRLSGNERNLQAGEYSIDPGITSRGLIKKMVAGEVVQHSFTIVEGWTFSQMIGALNNDPNIKHTIKKLSSAEIMEKLSHPGEFPEGRFAPSTYFFPKNFVDIEILITAYNLQQKRLTEIWNNKAPDLHYKCSYEALIAASLIEKETGVDEEKPIISGVILRRLKKGMPLQIDPTVIYGLGEKFTGKLHKKDMQIDHAYNTYKRRGLPPTPIAMPGEDSIKAALNPQATSYLYYVSKGDGTHEFSETYEEQMKAINKYLRNSDRN